MDRAVRVHRFRPAAQQHGVSRAQAQRGGIGGDVGAAFVNDPDQSDRYPHPHQLEPTGRDIARDYFAARTRQRGDRLEADHALRAAPSFSYDVVVVLTSAIATKALSREPAAAAFLRDAFEHVKVIGYAESSMPLLTKAEIGHGQPQTTTA